MNTSSYDTIVIGAGIAGATCAAHLASHQKVALIEAEEAAGYHSTGRSAAIWIQNYGPPDVQTLTGLSRAFFENPPAGFTDSPIMMQRGICFLAPEEQVAHLDRLLSEGIGLKEISIPALRELVPALRPEYAARAAIETDAFDMDVAALHQGFLRQLKALGGTLSLRSRSGTITRKDGIWHVEVTGGTVFTATTLVNAAGSWGDVVAEQAGVPILGLVPKRRTGVVIDPVPFIPTHWPMLNDVDHTWYCRAEARTKLMVSPADETDDTPHDVQPDELDVAVAIDRMQQALDIEVRRVEHSWAGLRTFTPDRSLAFGWDAAVPGFMWCVGQGGYGIQTSPAAGQYIADLVCGRDPGAAGSIAIRADPRRFAVGAEA
jgi:D-arginine dehydrogenase